MTGLQRDHFATARVEPGEVVGRDDHVGSDPVDKRAVRHIQLDAIPAAQAVDVREGRPVGRAVPGDVDELALAGEMATRVNPGPTLERVAVRPGDDDHVQAELRHANPADRVALLHLRPVAPRRDGDQMLFLRPSDAFRRHGHDEGRDTPLVARGETVLLHVRVDGGDRVLPEPHGQRPRDPQRAEHDEERTQPARYAARHGAGPAVAGVLDRACRRVDHLRSIAAARRLG